MDANRRRRSRVATHFTASFTRPGKPEVELVTVNISLKGMLAEPAPAMRGGTSGVVQIRLASDAVIEIECRVIRSDATGVAIDFLPMEGESFYHLRNLVRYNAPDADQIDDELAKPAF
jgi:hypothetical protein